MHYQHFNMGPNALPNMNHLATLPRELLRSICQHLDVKSARSFALTCKALRQPAECRIWRDLFPFRKYSYTHWRLGLENISPQRDGFDPPALQSPLLETLLGLLRAAPWRGPAVRYLEIRSSAAMPKQLLDVLNATSGITELTLSIKCTARVPELVKGLIWPFQLFQALSGHLQSLNRAKIESEIFGQETLATLLRAASNLKELHLISYFLKGFFDTPPIDFTSSIPTDLALETLIIDCSPAHTVFLTEVINNSSTLANVALCKDDPAMMPRSPEFWNALSKKSIKSLHLNSDQLEMMNLEQLSAVEHLTVRIPYELVGLSKTVSDQGATGCRPHSVSTPMISQRCTVIVADERRTA